MDWWIWLIIVVGVIAALFVAFIAVQAKRRSGGVKATKRGAQ